MLDNVIQNLEGFLIERFKSLIKSAKEKEELTASAFEHLAVKPLSTLDELGEAYAELIHLLTHKEYYNLLARIEKGESMRDAETDPKKREFYESLLKQRYAELEKLMPRSDIA